MTNSRKKPTQRQHLLEMRNLKIKTRRYRYETIEEYWEWGDDLLAKKLSCHINTVKNYRNKLLFGLPIYLADGNDGRTPHNVNHKEDKKLIKAYKRFKRKCKLGRSKNTGLSLKQFRELNLDKWGHRSVESMRLAFQRHFNLYDFVHKKTKRKINKAKETNPQDFFDPYFYFFPKGSLALNSKTDIDNEKANKQIIEYIRRKREVPALFSWEIDGSTDFLLRNEEKTCAVNIVDYFTGVVLATFMVTYENAHAY